MLDALLDDVDGDWLTFAVGPGTRLRDDAYQRPAWRFTVRADLAGKPYPPMRLDVVARPEEVTGVEQLPLPDVLGFAGIAPRTVPVADSRQQYAEKLHALTRLADQVSLSVRTHTAAHGVLAEHWDVTREPKD